jgi:hypothetical protein
MRFAISLSVLVLVSACDLRTPPRAEDVVGVWRAENGAQVALAEDGELQVEEFDPGCWSDPGSERISGGGTWTIPAPRNGVDPRTVELEISSGAGVRTQVLYGGVDELLCVVGDPDNVEYVHFFKQPNQ